ncbi:MAG: EF-hand domain-containing protein [bacterium JZ-2024 1]
MRALITLGVAALILAAADGAQVAPSDSSEKKSSNPVRASTIFSPHFLNYCNKDKNAIITRQEFRDCFVDFFNLADENKDGVISRQEYDAAVKKSREAQEKKWEEMFKSSDKDADGKLSSQEFSESELKKIDADHDGSVSLKEFLAARMKGFYVVLLPGGFRINDENGDGKVTLEEQQKRVALIFKEFDENMDGVISQTDAILQGEKQKKAQETKSESKGKESDISTDTTGSNRSQS